MQVQGGCLIRRKFMRWYPYVVDAVEEAGNREDADWLG